MDISSFNHRKQPLTPPPSANEFQIIVERQHLYGSYLLICHPDLGEMSLCYAVRCFQQQKYIHIEVLETTSLANFQSHLLSAGIQRLFEQYPQIGSIDLLHPKPALLQALHAWGLFLYAKPGAIWSELRGIFGDSRWSLAHNHQ